MGAAIIAGVDAEAVEHGVVRDWCLPVSLGRDAGGDPSVGQSGTKPVCVVARSPSNVFAFGQRGLFLITKMMQLTIRRSSTHGTPCDSGKIGLDPAHLRLR
jgi:hypothetical protein